MLPVIRFLPIPSAKYFLELAISLALVVIGNNNKVIFSVSVITTRHLIIGYTFIAHKNTPKKCFKWKVKIKSENNSQSPLVSEKPVDFTRKKLQIL